MIELIILLSVFKSNSKHMTYSLIYKTFTELMLDMNKKLTHFRKAKII